MRALISAGCCIAVALAAAPPAAKTDAKNAKSVPPAPVAPKAGIKTPGLQIPFESLKAEVQIPVDTPGWVMAGDSIYVENRTKDALVKIETKTNKVLDPVAAVKQPCSGILTAFGSLWIPSCADQGFARLDAKTGKVTAQIAAGVADVMMGLAASPDSVWALTDSKTTLSRIDPDQNKVVDQLRLPAACDSVAFGEGSVWVTCPSYPRLLRIDPNTNLVDKRIEVSAGARAVAFGAGSVWVLCEKDGKVDRIDPKTNKVVKSIELGVPNAGGNLAFGEGYLWVSQTGFPLTRIETDTDKERVAQQFWGDGGGLISVTSGAIWLSNAGKGSVSRIDPKRAIATLAE